MNKSNIFVLKVRGGDLYMGLNSNLYHKFRLMTKTTGVVETLLNKKFPVSDLIQNICNIQLDE